jgi:hypothetical protein
VKGERWDGLAIRAIEVDWYPIFAACKHRNAIHYLYLDPGLGALLVWMTDNQYDMHDSKSCSISDHMACGTRNRHNYVETQPLGKTCQLEYLN